MKYKEKVKNENIEFLYGNNIYFLFVEMLFCIVLSQWSGAST